MDAQLTQEYERLKNKYEKQREYQKAYRETHLEYFRDKQRERRRRIKEMTQHILETYGTTESKTS